MATYTNTGDFSADVSKWAAATKQKVDTLVRESVITLGERIVERSPVGNPSLWTKEFVVVAKKLGWIHEGYRGGRFRANWSYGYGAAPAETFDLIDPTGAASRDRIQAGVLAAKAGGVHYIANNLPYAMALENGHSTQAPHGMVGLAVVDFQGIVADEIARGGA